MSNQKFEVTNPEAIKLLADIKSGQAFAPVKSVITKYKWIIIGVLTLLALFIAIIIGKQLSRTKTPVYLPPTIETITPTSSRQVRSSFDGLRNTIINFSATLPDPALPAVDNQISLEATLIE